MPRIRETISGQSQRANRRMQRETISERLNYSPSPPSIFISLLCSCVSLISCPRNRCFESSFSLPLTSIQAWISLSLSCNYATSVKLDRYNVHVCVYSRYIFIYYFIREFVIFVILSNNGNLTIGEYFER